jgi:phage regulator Rha-like protein
MKDLIEIHGNDLTTTTIIISEEFGRRHSDVVKSVKSLSDRKKISEISRTSFLYLDSQNRPQTAYRLSKRDALIAMPFIGGVKSEDGQIKLVDGFLRLEKELTRLREQRLTVDWQEARANSKCIRSIATNAIQSLEQLADKQGGMKGKPENRHYYETTTKMIYKQLFGDGTLKNVRDKLDILQLQFLSICEQACADEIQKLAELDIDYHAIYAEAKKRVIATVEGLSASRLTSTGKVVKLAWENVGSQNE